MLGILERSGIGKPIESQGAKAVGELWDTRVQRNEELLRVIREDVHSERLLQITREDAARGRMSQPVVVQKGGDVDFLLNPRFAVEQLKPDDTVKLRAVDNMSWAPQAQSGADRLSWRELREHSVNGRTVPLEKLKHETLDELVLAMTMHVKKIGVPGLWKADIDAAYRRVPVAPEHRWACGVALVAKEG